MSTRAPRPGTRVSHRGNTISFHGDSITAGGIGTLTYGDAFPVYACLASGGRLISVGYHGQGGETSTGGLTRLASALAKRPTYVHLLYGTNDIGQGISLGLTDAQIISGWSTNMALMVNKIIAAGSIPILGTIPPNNSGANSARTRLNQKANIWLRRFCLLNNVQLVDYYTLTVKDGIAESPGGNWKTVYALDGTHPNATGAGAMGALLWQAISNPSPLKHVFPMCTDLGETNQAIWIMRNTLWQGQSGAPGARPDNTSVLGVAGDANSVYSLVTNSLIPGNLQRLAFSSSATGLSMGLNTSAAGSSNANAGDIIGISGQFISDGNVGLQAQLILAGNTYKPMVITKGTPFSLGGYYMEVAMPAAGGLSVALLAAATSGVAGQVDFGYPSVVNLTQMLGETVPLNAN